LMDALPSLLFGWILCHLVASGAPLMPAVEGVMAPYCGYFAAFSLEDALPLWLG
jgi:hypothetical protein